MGLKTIDQPKFSHLNKRTEIFKIFRTILMFFSPIHFWMVYLFILFAYIYGLDPYGLWNPEIEGLVLPFYEYRINITLGVCIALWLVAMIRGIKARSTEKLLSRLYFLHAVCMLTYLDFVRNMGFFTRWSIITN